MQPRRPFMMITKEKVRLVQCRPLSLESAKSWARSGRVRQRAILIVVLKFVSERGAVVNPFQEYAVLWREFCLASHGSRELLQVIVDAPTTLGPVFDIRGITHRSIDSILRSPLPPIAVSQILCVGTYTKMVS